MQRVILSILVAAGIFSAAIVAADEQDTADPTLRLELNAAETTDAACLLSFMVLNEHAQDITKAVYETVLFDATGAVHQLTLFDFGMLPSGRPRVRQFAVQNIACDDIGSILINGATACDADGLDADICGATLQLNSRTMIEMLG